MTSKQFIEEISLEYKKRLKLLCTVICALAFLDIVFFDSNASALENFLILFGIGLFILVPYKLYRGASWAKSFIYYITILHIFSFLGFYSLTLPQRLATVVQFLSLLATIVFLFKNKEETHRYFHQPVTMPWKIMMSLLFFALFSLLTLVFFVERRSIPLMGEMRPLLVKDGFSSQKMMQRCLEDLRFKKIPREMNTAYCNCVGPNLDALYESFDAERAFISNFFRLSIRKHAIENLCMEHLGITVKK